MIKKLIYILALLILVILSGIGVVKYFQHQNIEELHRQHLDGRLIPHKVNSLGKLESVLDDGIRSFECDVFFYPKGEDGYFAIGHDHKEMTGTILEDLLKRTQGMQLKKIWLDLKNFDEIDATLMLKALDRLDQTYGIKRYAIVETPTRNVALSLISQAGYHTSLYLSIGRIRSMLATHNEMELNEEAHRVLNQIEQQGFSAVSFNSDVYPFVKKYLEPIAPNTLVYHTWNIVKFRDRDALKELESQPLFKDPRIRTIIYNYHYIHI